MKTTISEARLNDIVYLTLRKLYFQPVFGETAAPRECDIRVVMNLVVPKMVTGIESMILRCDEVSPRSHTVMYDIDTDDVFEEAKVYMEDHWFKEKVSCDVVKMKEFFDFMVEQAMKTPEDQCAVELTDA